MNLVVKEDTGLVDIFSPPVVHTPILKRQGLLGSRFREKLKGMVGGDRGQERKKGGGEGHPEREMTRRKLRDQGSGTRTRTQAVKKTYSGSYSLDICNLFCMLPRNLFFALW